MDGHSVTRPFNQFILDSLHFDHAHMKKKTELPEDNKRQQDLAKDRQQGLGQESLEDAAHKNLCTRKSNWWEWKYTSTDKTGKRKCKRKSKKSKNNQLVEQDTYKYTILMPSINITVNHKWNRCYSIECKWSTLLRAFDLYGWKKYHFSHLSHTRFSSFYAFW